MSTPTKYIVARTREFVTEAQQNGRFELIDGFMHPKLFDHTALPGQPAGPAGVHFGFGYLHKTFKDIQIEIMHCFAEGDVVFTHKVFRGRQVGEFQGKPGTGERVEFRIMDVVRFEEGRALEHWATFGPIGPSTR